MDVYNRLPEGVLAEVIGDTLYVQGTPTLYHQRIALKLMLGLGTYVVKNHLGELFPCPTAVYLDDDRTILIPDIIYISHDNNLVLDRKGVHGPPDLVIEILSPSTKSRDLTIKKDIYETAGVKEYWLVDPDTKDAFGYLIENGRYVDSVKSNSKIRVRILNKILHF
jgi:Uma2 family endonuclease